MPLDATLLKKIDKEITGGLPNEFKRIGPCERALNFYHGRFNLYPIRTEGADKYTKLAPRYSLITQRIINVLTGNLYREGPRRSMPDHPEASKWLDNIYRINCVDAAFQQADTLAGITDAAMFQVVPTEDPKKPIRILLWDASQFCVWLDPEDQLTPVAIGVRDKYDEQSRFTLWTDRIVRTYLTPKNDQADATTTKSRDFVYRNEKPNVLGLLPFSFVHWNFSLQDFWTFGLGGYLSQVNEIVNASLTMTNGCVAFNLTPIILTRGLAIGSRPSGPISPGDIWDLAADPANEGQGAAPSAEYLQADSSFVAASWEDIRSYLDHVLEMCGVPPGTIRMDVDAMRSGVAIVAEQIPLITWAKARQRPFSYFEDNLARLVLTIGAAHELVPDADAKNLQEALDDFSLQLRWGDMFPDIPGVERDTADQWLLDNGMSARIDVLMRRQQYTEEEAKEHLEKVAEHLEFEQKLFAKLQPVTGGDVDVGKKPGEKKPEAEPAPEPKPEPKAENEKPEEKTDE
jgi:hypothetical protein